MKLTALEIQLKNYGPDEGKYGGTVSFAGQYGTTEIILSAELSHEVLKLCADALVANTRDLAENLTAQIIEQAGLPAIAAPEEGPL